MRHLSTLTNILPVIAKSDSLSHTQTLTLKLSLLRDLRANQIPIFTFGKSFSELERNVVNGIPYAVSCLRDDAAEMDASLLMREEITEQYVESDLPYLVSCLTQNTAWLRFAETKKFLEWRNRQFDSPDPTTNALTLINPAESYAMARVGDHIDREERLARVRLVQWAGDMRRQIRKRMAEEEEEYKHIEAQDRIKWLVARLNEAIAVQENQTGTSLIPTHRRHSGTRRKHRVVVDRDPLGLVWVKERWGPRVQKSIVWIVEAGVVLGSGWVVWKYVVENGISGWFITNARG